MSGPRRRLVHAFTLVELLVVLAITSLLMAMLLPTLQEAQTAAKQTKCLSNLRGIGGAMVSYAQDWGDKVTPSAGTSGSGIWRFHINLQLHGYVSGTEGFVCPEYTNTFNIVVGSFTYKTTYGMNTCVGSAGSATSGNPSVKIWRFAEIESTRRGLATTPMVMDSASPLNTGTNDIYIHLNTNAGNSPYSTTPPANIASIHKKAADVLFGDIHAKNIKAPYAPTGQPMFWLDPASMTNPSYIRY